MDPSLCSRPSGLHWRHRSGASNASTISRSSRASSDAGTVTSFNTSSHASTRYSFSTGTSSPAPSVTSHRSRPHPLSQEVQRSPDEVRKPASATAVDLFPYTRGRLTEIVVRMPGNMNHDSMSTDDLRLQMLDAVFGWEQDIEELLRDERKLQLRRF